MHLRLSEVEAMPREMIRATSAGLRAIKTALKKCQVRVRARRMKKMMLMACPPLCWEVVDWQEIIYTTNTKA